MMTEDDAKQRWCPLVRFKSSESGSAPAFNRSSLHPSGDPEAMCIGSKCMAWREKAIQSDDDPGHLNILGYCGAFGGQ